jgi:hypothetical protein
VLSAFGAAIRTLSVMSPLRTLFVVAVLTAGLLLLLASTAFAASAVDQYSEGIPTASGQKQSNGAVAHPGGTATIPPQTRAVLEKTKKGSAAEKAANITAPTRSGTSSGGSDGGNGLGLLLILILAGTLGLAVAIYLARRRAGPAPG